MKEILAFIMLACLFVAFVAVLAGFFWVFEGRGLHPALAAVLACFAGLAGGFAAATIDRIE